MPHIQSIAAIPQIIEKSIYIESQPNNDTDTNPDVAEYQCYVCGLNIGGEEYTVLAKVAVDKNGNRYYDHNLTAVAKGKLIDIANNEQSAVISGFGTTPDTESTTNLLRKYRELISTLQTNLSKIVDANGEPKVTEHSTWNEDFYTFYINRLGESSGESEQKSEQKRKLYSVQEVNNRFNEELDAFKNGKHKGLLHLGYPSEILKVCGVGARELTISPRKLSRHLKKHHLTTDDLKNLVYAIQEPIMVYRHGKKHPNIVVITEVMVNDGKLSVSIELDDEGNVVDISNISSVHSKDALTELDRLSELSEEELKEALKWVDKERVSGWLMPTPYMESGASLNPKHISTTKVIQNFENPKIEPRFSLIGESEQKRKLYSVQDVNDRFNEEFTNAFTNRKASNLNLSRETIEESNTSTDAQISRFDAHSGNEDTTSSPNMQGEGCKILTTTA